MRIKIINDRDDNFIAIKKPMFLFCYHKSGTVLLSKIFKNISKVLGLNFYQIYGCCDKLPEKPDIVLFCHSCISEDILRNEDFIGIHIIRDPRELIASGYLYHLRTKEEWCNKKPSDLEEDFKFPMIPTFLAHTSKEIQKEYIDELDGKSYKSVLQELSIDDGIIFEMDHYSGWTLDCMQTWNYNDSKIYEVKFEDIMDDFDTSFINIFKKLGFNQTLLLQCIQIAQKEDVKKMDIDIINKNNHISKDGYQKWQKYFNNNLKQTFIKRYPTLLSDLGYIDNNW